MPSDSIEIERKFLLDSPPDQLESQRSEEIRQGYLASAGGSLHVRIRSIGGGYFLTIKQGKGRKRIEVEVPITFDQFEALWPLTSGKRLSKTRYYASWVDYVFEIDFYKEKLTGLITVEVEFDSEATAEAFIPPSWFGMEITGDPRYENYNLAVNGKPELSYGNTPS